MSNRGAIDETTLQAYIDGELSKVDCVAVEEAIERDPLLAKQLALYDGDKSRLAEIYGRMHVEPLPVKWLELIESKPRKTSKSYLQGIAVIAAVLLIAIGIPSLYQRSARPQESIIEEALAARSESIPVRQTIAVTASAHASAADRAVAAALSMHVRAPDLSRMGYALSAVRVYDGVPGGKSVELLYQKANTTVFALYLRHPSSPARFDQFKQGRLRVCIWQDDVLGTVMTGEMSAAEMQRLASLAYTGLES